MSDVSLNADEHTPFYWGIWYTDKTVPKHANTDGPLIVPYGSDVATVDRSLKTGKFPLVNGNSKFYLEVCANLSNNNKENWPAIWMLPIEHNPGRQKMLSSDPEHFERWLELDIDEGGFGKGTAGTAHSWMGIWPNYEHIQNANNINPSEIDRATPNCYALSFDPDTLTVTWWLNGKQTARAGPPYVPPISRLQHFFLILSTFSHESDKSYEMRILRVQLFL